MVFFRKPESYRINCILSASTAQTEKTGDENMNIQEEQIETLARHAGMNPESRHCTFSGLYLSLVKFIGVLMGSPIESRTMNYDCFKRAIENLPSEAFETLNALFEAISSKNTNLREAQKQKSAVESKFSTYRRKAQKWKADKQYAELNHAIMFSAMYSQFRSLDSMKAAMYRGKFAVEDDY
jgi:hypothetical protein